MVFDLVYMNANWDVVFIIDFEVIVILLVFGLYSINKGRKIWWCVFWSYLFVMFMMNFRINV